MSDPNGYHEVKQFTFPRDFFGNSYVLPNGWKAISVEETPSKILIWASLWHRVEKEYPILAPGGGS